MKQEEQLLVDQEIENVGKTGNKISTTLKRPVSEYPFPSHQKRCRISPSDQFEKS